VIKTKEKKKKTMPRPLTPQERGDKLHEKRMRQRAAILSIEQCTPTTFRVWGGETDHMLTVVNGLVVCDCLGWNTARHHICSHVYKHSITYGDLKRK